MESIGLKLKEKRLELGFSLDAMSEKTKLSKIQLKAIEEGNISFFKDDLSYLTYFVRYYANALGINYNELRGELDQTIAGYTDDLSVSKVEEMDRIQAGITKKVKMSKTKSKKPSLIKIDFASVGMIALAIAILLGLGFVFVKVIIPSLQKGPDDQLISRPKPPNMTDPDEESPEGEKPEGETPEGEKPEGENPDGENPEGETPGEPEENPGSSENFDVTKRSSLEYDISGWKENEDFLFEMVINVSTTLRFTMDDVVQTTPASGVIYAVGETVAFTTKSIQDKKLEISIGFPFNNQIKINGIDVELDSSVTGAKTPQTVTFRFIGE